MSDLPAVLPQLEEDQIQAFTARAPRQVGLLARMILRTRHVTDNMQRIALCFLGQGITHELVQYVAYWDPERLDECYPNLWEDVLADYVGRWRLGQNPF
jgi:hypothetical protein